ncbi:MAG: hypothetical protein J6R22_03585 [Alphaproteobacteria bacterium]|nr:hypothetical protein [Alphaproteobacteria bacterium]
MKTYTYIFIASALFCGSAHAATTCSRANLTRCLDSVCAINASANTAARCNYCGFSSDNDGPVIADSKGGLKSLSAGSSTKYNLSDKELKSAPTDSRMERFRWAIEKCLTKISGCTPEDATEVYTPLVEQSCRAAGIDAKMDSALSDAHKTKDEDTCRAQVTNCMLSDKRCTSSFANCESSADFDKNFSLCSSEAAGCGEYLADVRTELTSNRDNIMARIENDLLGYVKKLQTKRQNKINTAKAGCENNKAYETCVTKVCEENMPDKCANKSKKTNLKKEEVPGELVAAQSICKFYQIACEALNIEDKKAKK